MINPKELRIGNLVKYLGTPYPSYPLKDGIVEVEEILSDGVNRSQGDSTLYEADKLEGIPLTTEWLERCGFEKSHSTYLNPEGNIYIYEGPGFWNGQNGWPVGIRDDISMRIVRCIDCVHQLQSLYLALAGEEITIKETV